VSYSIQLKEIVIDKLTFKFAESSNCVRIENFIKIK